MCKSVPWMQLDWHWPRRSLQDSFAILLSHFPLVLSVRKKEYIVLCIDSGDPLQIRVAHSRTTSTYRIEYFRGGIFFSSSQWNINVCRFFIRIRFFSSSFFTSLCNDWLSQWPTAKIYVKYVESLKSLKCLAQIVLNHFRSVCNSIYTIIIVTPISLSPVERRQQRQLPPHDDFIHLGWMDTFTMPHSHSVITYNAPLSNKKLA